MKIHEYQAKALFKTYGIPVPAGKPFTSPEEITRYLSEAGGAPLVLKAQVHGGGRGKAGGIRVVRTAEEARSVASDLLGRQLATHQTGSEGRPVDILLAEEVVRGERELYLAVAIDRPHCCVAVVASSTGGVEIEKTAREKPEAVIVERIHSGVGLRPFQTARIAFALGLPWALAPEFRRITEALYHLFTEKDCTLAEINPLVLAGERGFLALDGKVDFDDNALFRHPDTASLRDTRQESPLEVEASRYNLNYIKLSGNVGCMVNGAGLAMATMDLIKQVGAEPANFLDVGGGATSRMVREGLKILLEDQEVRVILINIFGGILRCDVPCRRGDGSGQRAFNSGTHGDQAGGDERGGGAENPERLGPYLPGGLDYGGGSGNGGPKSWLGPR